MKICRLFFFIFLLMLNHRLTCSEHQIDFDDLIIKKPVELDRLMHQEIDWIDANVQRYYPFQIWKKKSLELCWADEVKKAHNSIKSTTNISDYTKIVKCLFFALKDHHINLNFNLPGDPKPTAIPITFFTVDDRLFVKKVHSTKIENVQTNDEVIRIGDQPTMTFFEERSRADFGQWRKGHDLIAHMLLWNEPGRTGQILTGRIEIELLDGRTGAPKVVQVKYEDDTSAFPSFEGDEITAPKPDLGPPIELIKTNDCVASWHDHQSSGKKIGYLRIKTFNHGQNGEPAGKSIRDFEYLIKRLEANTDLLILDLRNNFGGCLDYCLALTSCLTPTPLKMFQEARLIGTHIGHSYRNRLKEVEEWLENGIPIDLVNANYITRGEISEKFGLTHLTRDYLLEYQSYYRSFIDQFEKEEIMSKWKARFQKLPPNRRARYTRPILTLINETTTSAPEYMSGLLQDNQRALLFGTTTAGAGGGISQMEGKPMRGPFMIYYLNFPTSIEQRLNKNLIENVGVEPDVHCPLVMDDYTNRGASYNKRLNQTIESLLVKN